MHRRQHLIAVIVPGFLLLILLCILTVATWCYETSNVTTASLKVSAHGISRAHHA